MFMKGIIFVLGPNSLDSLSLIYVNVDFDPSHHTTHHKQILVSLSIFFSAVGLSSLWINKTTFLHSHHPLILSILEPSTKDPNHFSCSTMLSSYNVVSYVMRVCMAFNPFHHHITLHPPSNWAGEMCSSQPQTVEKKRVKIALLSTWELRLSLFTSTKSHNDVCLPLVFRQKKNSHMSVY